MAHPTDRTKHLPASTGRILVVLATFLLVHASWAFTFSSSSTPTVEHRLSTQNALFFRPSEDNDTSSHHHVADASRRSAAVSLVLSSFALGVATFPTPVQAKPDCMTDCMKNCKKVVPNDTSNYCLDSCIDYCAQTDRRDGLSGSVSSEGGEVGILGGTFGQGTVVNGEDKPPVINLPGLNFNSKEGKKLLGL